MKNLTFFVFAIQLWLILINSALFVRLEFTESPSEDSFNVTDITQTNGVSSPDIREENSTETARTSSPTSPNTTDDISLTTSDRRSENEEEDPFDQQLWIVFVLAGAIVGMATLIIITIVLCMCDFNVEGKYSLETEPKRSNGEILEFCRSESVDQQRRPSFRHRENEVSIKRSGPLVVGDGVEPAYVAETDFAV